jgi:hypothetical protein
VLLPLLSGHAGAYRRTQVKSPSLVLTLSSCTLLLLLLKILLMLMLLMLLLLLTGNQRCSRGLDTYNLHQPMHPTIGTSPQQHRHSSQHQCPCTRSVTIKHRAFCQCQHKERPVGRGRGI